MDKSFKLDRDLMIRSHLQGRGVNNLAVLEAMKRVPREKFVNPTFVSYAYKDCPLPIEEGQTISQPYIVAKIAQALELSASDKILDVGTGSGYAAAVFSHLVSQVYSVERQLPLVISARRRLSDLGYMNVYVQYADGYLGWKQYAPFQAIAVSAACEGVPADLLDQLDIGGRLVIPIGSEIGAQRLVKIKRVKEKEYYREVLEEVQFVPLVKGLSS